MGRRTIRVLNWSSETVCILQHGCYYIVWNDVCTEIRTRIASLQYMHGWYFRLGLATDFPVSFHQHLLGMFSVHSQFSYVALTSSISGRQGNSAVLPLL